MTASPASGAQTQSAAQLDAAKAHLVEGSVYVGRVETNDIVTGQCVVRLEDVSVYVQCLVASAFFGALLGVKVTSAVPVGTRVLLVYKKTASIVIGSLPEGTYENVGYTAAPREQDRTRLAVGLEKNVLNSVLSPSAGILGDAIEGELDMTSMFGVGIRILTAFASIQGGDLARVEASLIDSTVRILARALKVHSATGDHFDYVDGATVTEEQTGTSYDHESFGLLEPTDPKLDNTAIAETNEDNELQTGRWRWLRLKGWLGSWLQEWVRDPETVIGRISDDVHGSGKSRFSRLNDGTVLVQSVAEICFERVTRIPVPRRIKPHTAPDGNDLQELNRLDAQMLRLWKMPTDPADGFKMAFQIREYARYLSGFMSLSRILQTDKEWSVASESETPAPSWNSAETDVETANAQAPYSYYDVYACMRVLRDGTIMHISGDGGAIVMGGGRTWISSAGSMYLSAPGDVVIQSGQDVIIGARRNFEVAAMFGGLAMKARTWFRALCEKGSMYLKSDAMDPASADYSTETGDVNNPAPEVLGAGVVIDAVKSGVSVTANRTISITSDGRPDNAGDRNDRTASVVITSRQQHVDIDAGKDIGLRARGGGLIAHVKKDLVIRANIMWADVLKELRVGDRWMRVTGGGTHVGNIKTSRCYASEGFVGKANDSGRPTHAGHIFSVKDEDALSRQSPQFPDIPSSVELADTFSTVGVFNPFALIRPIWRMHDPSKYTHNTQTKFALYENLTSQKFRVESTPGYVSYTPPSLLQADRTDSGSAPWPGANATHLIHSAGDPLHIPSSKKGSQLFSQTDLTPTRFGSFYLDLRNPET